MMSNNLWCVYGIVGLIAYAGCVDLYRLHKKRKGGDGKWLN
jgi:hypothetical protein